MAKRQTCKSTVRLSPLAAGSLDLRTPLGIGLHYLFRYVLNVDSIESGRLSRMPGWVGWMACEAKDANFNRGNLDLHDQLEELFYKVASATVTESVTIGTPGTTMALGEVFVDKVTGFVAGSHVSFEGLLTGIVEEVREKSLFLRVNQYTPLSAGKTITAVNPTSEIHFEREPINHIVQFTSSCDGREFIACTTSRIYLSTGTAANWRLLAFDLSGNSSGNLVPYGKIRWMTAQLGNYILFTNDYDFVLSWRIGDEPDPVGGWSVKYVQSLLELDIRRAGCIVSWNGFILIGDIETGLGRECSRIYWCDFNNPMEWAPGGESLAGYVDLGKTEKVLRMEILGGQLRVYTTNAIFNCVMVGGEEIFRFIEIYRGPDSLGFRFGIANLGDSHIYLTNESMVETQLYNNTPVKVDWMHRAAGAIYKGIPDIITHGMPGPERSFGPLNTAACNEVICGYDLFRRQVWVSWPTTTKDDTVVGGIKRMTMVLSKLYGQATLVDHPFSAFASFIPTLNEPVRDWMVRIGACPPEDVAQYILPYEGRPYYPVPPGTPAGPTPPPTYLVNENENPHEPVHPDSVCAMYGQEDIKIKCKPCFTPMAFAMASLTEWNIKQIEPKVRLREVWNPATQDWDDYGYGSILQTEHSMMGTDDDKRLRRADVDFVHGVQAIPINLHAEIGVGGLPDCMDWFPAEPWPVACDYELGEDPAVTRQPGSPSFPFYQTGRYAALRILISSGDPTLGYNFEPLGGTIDFNRAALTLDTLSSCK